MKIFYWLVVSFVSISTALTSSTKTPKTNTSQKKHSLKEGYVPIEDGALYYKEIGEGTPIIVLHGGPGMDQTYLQPQLYKLAKKHKLIFYDQYGSGKSAVSKLNPKHVTLDKFIDDIETLRKTLGLEKFILMGHSWGGCLALHYAVHHQDQLLGLVILDTAPLDKKGEKAFDEDGKKKTKLFKKDLEPVFDADMVKSLTPQRITSLYQKLFSLYFYNPRRINQLNLHYDATSAQNLIHIFGLMDKPSLYADVHQFTALKKLRVPTLILHGKEDLIPNWVAKEVHEMIPGSKLVILKRCGHFSYIEQPAKFFGHINRFLKKIPNQ